MIGGHNVHFDASAIGFGLFVNWKMSGAAYPDYLNIREGSPITT